MQVTFVTVPIVDLPTASLNSQGMSTQAETSNVAIPKFRSTCLLSSSCRYLGIKWGGPSAVLGLRGEAIDA